MRRKVITYFSLCGYEEDGTKVYKVLKWVCEDKEEFEYAINCIDKDDIISID